LELDEKLECGLIRIFLETEHHLLPVVFEDIRSLATWFVTTSPVGLRADDYASGTSVLAPAIDASEERLVLPDSKSAGELDADLFEELRCADVRECF
jgi:hypothetical protein